MEDAIFLIVKASDYHDHNWGTRPMSTLFKNWYWGKVHTEDCTMTMV